MDIFHIIVTYKEAFLGGLFVTLKLTLLIWIIGIVIGSIIGILGSEYKSEIGKPSKIVSFLISGIPILVLLFWLHFPLQAILDVVIDPFWTAVLALSLVNIFFVSDLVRNTLDLFPKEYVESAKTLGLNKRQTLYSIQIPIIIRQILPSLLSIQANILQLTLFASLISVPEIFRVAQNINAQIYKPVEIYSALAIFFLIILLPFNGLIIYFKKKYSKDLLTY
jgi:His/Glu/Gln/Arg/opine family amino acid ABC transporter permease subunit